MKVVEQPIRCMNITWNLGSGKYEKPIYIIQFLITSLYKNFHLAVREYFY